WRPPFAAVCAYGARLFASLLRWLSRLKRRGADERSVIRRPPLGIEPSRRAAQYALLLRPTLRAEALELAACLGGEFHQQLARRQLAAECRGLAGPQRREI